MIRVKRSFLILVLLFSLMACSQQPTAITGPAASETFTPFVAGTETALASDVASPTAWVAGTETAQAIASSSPTAWVAGTQTATAVASSSPTLPPLPTISATLPAFHTPVSLPEGTFSPVLFGRGPFLLLGGIKLDQGWLSGVEAAQYMGNKMAYDFFSPNGFFQVPGAVPEYSPICRNYSMGSSVALPEPMFGVASGWVTVKRGATDLSTENPSYIQAAMEWFQSQGNSPAEIHINRILQSDIEGDGVNEVLMSMSYFKDASGHMTETGDYSVVLMRKVIGNSVLTIPLVKDYYVTSIPEMSYPYSYRLAGALDLNRDGTLEVIVEVSRWEGGGALVYRVDGQNVREVLRTIC